MTEVRIPPARSRFGHAPALAILGAWAAIYTWRSVQGHRAFGTNAFDLSMLDYSLWNSLHGRPGFVPFIGHSIFSHHFTPVLWLLLPIYALFQSPVCLIVLQLLATGAAGWLFYHFERRIGVDHVIALALLGVMLLSRRTHSATSSFFYPECLQAALTFAVVALWKTPGWRYWALAVLLLTTKEDAAVYLAAFALLQLFAKDANRARIFRTVALASVWFVVGMGVLVPMIRVRDGLPAANSLIDARYSSEGGSIDAGDLAGRSFSRGSASHVLNLLVTTGFLPVAGWSWLGAAVPGVLVDVAARPENPQAGMIGHYFWPILPWLFMAAAAGALALQRRWPRAARAWVLLLLCGTLADSPALRGLASRSTDPRAADVRTQLEALPYRQADIVLAQSNLIPHLPHSNGIFAIGGEQPPPRMPDLVLATPVGNLWPGSPDEVDALIRDYAANPGYEQVAGGPLFAFRLRSHAASPVAPGRAP